MSKEPRIPDKVIRAGGVSAAIWTDLRETERETVVEHSIRIKRTYKDKQSNEFVDTDYFHVKDLPKLQLVAAEAFKFLTLREDENNSA